MDLINLPIRKKRGENKIFVFFFNLRLMEKNGSDDERSLDEVFLLIIQGHNE